jgi:hypothetical protein
MHRICLSLLLIAAVSGCHSHGAMVKREAESSCPTDIRQMVPWCAGEDAIFHCPCGLSGEFHGHKPTCWRTWPAPATVWRDSYCGGVLTEMPVVADEPEMMVLPPMEEVPAPVEEAPIETLEGEGAAAPTLQPLPQASTFSEPANQTVQQASHREDSAPPARSGLAQRFREMGRIAN